jgi:hypothetical protein
MAGCIRVCSAHNLNTRGERRKEWGYEGKGEGEGEEREKRRGKKKRMDHGGLNGKIGTGRTEYIFSCERGVCSFLKNGN